MEREEAEIKIESELGKRTEVTISGASGIKRTTRRKREKDKMGWNKCIRYW